MTSLDYIVLFAYLVFITLYGLWVGRGQKTYQDYFLGSRKIQWWAVSLSLVATKTSIFTFISIPGLAYISNMSFLQLAFGYIIGRIFISIFLIPKYYEGKVETVYAFLEIRFSKTLRTITSLIFQFTRLLSDSIRLFATAIPLAILTGWDFSFCILLLGAFTFIYTLGGGLKAVIWTDVLQFFIYLAGALVSVYILFDKDSFDIGLTISKIPIEKLTIITFAPDGFNDFFSDKYNLISGIVGGAFLSIGSHGVDQLLVQRVLSCSNSKDAKKAMISSGFLVAIQFFIFLFIGTLLYAFYDAKQFGTPDEIFPTFVLNYIPAGLRGLILSAMFAAAMSTLSSCLNSISSSTLIDILYNVTKKLTEKQKLLFSRLLTCIWGILIIGIALFFENPKTPIVEIGLSITSFTYGGLIGLYFLGLTAIKVHKSITILSLFASLGTMSYIILSNTFSISWTWYVFIGTVSSMIISFLLIFIYKIFKIKFN